MQESKVTAKGQTTLPRDVRYIVEDGRVQILKAHHVSELAGMLHRPGQRTVSLEEMNEAIAAGAIESAS